jgi:hypothetical protein
MRTQALFGIIAVVLRAATLIFQSLVIGGIVFHRWIATNDDDKGILLVRLSAVGLALTQLLYLGFNAALLNHSLGLRLADVVAANFFVTGLVTIVASLAIAATPSSRLVYPGNLVTLLSLVVLACGVLASHAVSRMQDRAFLAACTAAHQFAAAVWIGRPAAAVDEPARPRFLPRWTTGALARAQTVFAAGARLGGGSCLNRSGDGISLHRLTGRTVCNVLRRHAGRETRVSWDSRLHRRMQSHLD